MNNYDQIYLNVSRANTAMTIEYYYEKGYLCIQTSDISSNKVLMTFEKCARFPHVTDKMFTAKKIEDK